MEVDEAAAGQEALEPAGALPPAPVSSKRKREAATAERHGQHAPRPEAPHANKKRQKWNHQSQPVKQTKLQKQEKKQKQQLKLQNLTGSNRGSDDTNEDWR